MSFESHNEWTLSGNGLDIGKSGMGIRQEGLSTFWLSAPNKFDIQIANDLFHKYEQTKDPVVLGKINDFRLDVMKRSAEVELTLLDPPKTRSEIEREMDDPRIPHAFKNEKLPYVLVTYIRNVEKMAEARRQEVERIAAETKARTDALKTEMPSPTSAPGAETKSSAGQDETPLYEFLKPETAPEGERKATVPEGVKVVDAPLDREETISKNFIAANRKEIDELIGKIPNPKVQEAMITLLKGPTKPNIRIFQEGINMKWEGASWKDGRFGGRTMNALREYAGVKKPAAAPSAAKAPDAPKTARPSEAKRTAGKPLSDTELAEKAVAEELAKEAKKEQAAKSVKEAVLFDLQRNVVKNLAPVGNDVYVAEGSLFASGYGASFRFDSQTKSWSWLDSPNPSDPTLKNKWQPVSGLEGVTANGVTKLPNFSFNEKAQGAVTAILTAQRTAKESGIALWSPSADSKSVQRIPT